MLFQPMLFQQIKAYGRLIKFSHTVFALPFALAAVVLAHREHPLTWTTFAWIVAAMAGARSAAMGFNRFADYRFDALNPRTAYRPSVTGEIGRKAIIVFVAVSCAFFILSAAMLGRLCLTLSLPVLCVLFLYSYTKRFTALSHLFLGFAIGLAPAGAWVAVAGSLDVRICYLSLALMTYIAGFDILYACQDADFDRREGLFSMPARLGVAKALEASCMLHGFTLISLVAVYLAFHLGHAYLLGLLIVSGLLVAEHRLVRPGRLENINIAFFHVNSAISILFFLSVLMG